MQITVADGVILVDGIKFGVTYHNHIVALHQANQIKILYYPKAEIVDKTPTIPKLKTTAALPKISKKRTKKNKNLVSA